MLKIKKILGISLVLLFLLSATAGAASAVTASCKINVPLGGAPLTVKFTDTSTGGYWKWWSWGDGTGSSSRATIIYHTYKKPGDYHFFLKETDYSCKQSSYCYATINVPVIYYI